MSLLSLANSDLGLILEDAVGGFGTTVTLIPPTGASLQATGGYNDVSEMVDPVSGEVVRNRCASLTLRISSLPALPFGVSDATQKPWRVTMNGTTYKIFDTAPDKGMGMVILYLEPYVTAAN